MLLYDITSRYTFTNVLGWMDSIREHASPMIKVALVGHKTDLEEERQVSAEEGQKVSEVWNKKVECGQKRSERELKIKLYKEVS